MAPAASAPARPEPRPFAHEQWPLVVAVALYWFTVGVLVWQGLRLNQGYLAYPLDDPYIHMAMAKNTALHGVWGVTPYAFSSTSSSPLWTVMIAAVYRITGVGVAAPLWVNVAAGTLVLWAAGGLMRRSNAGPVRTLVALVAFVFGSALPTLTITGMEHTLHGLLTLAFAATGVQAMSAEGRSRHAWRLAVIAAALASIRYEGLFAVIVMAMLLAAAGQKALGSLVAACGVVPVLLFGVWSVAHGWYVLPNSVLLKGNVPVASVMGVAKLLVGWNAANALQMNPHLLVLVAASLTILLRLRPASLANPLVTLNMFFVGVTALHLEFGKTGWFFRYEAYLLMLGLAAVGATAASWVPDWRTLRAAFSDRLRVVAAVLLLVTAAVPIAVRSVRALLMAAPFTNITFNQQVQMGRFLGRFYEGRTVAVNDIGAMNFYADIHLLDLVGLGTMEVARLRRAGNYNRDQIEALARRSGVDIAIVYDSWLLANGGVPATWHKVGEWTGSVPDSTVAFYGVGPEHAAELHRHLQAFTPDLPAGVTPKIQLDW